MQVYIERPEQSYVSRKWRAGGVCENKHKLNKHGFPIACIFTAVIIKLEIKPSHRKNISLRSHAASHD